MPQVDVIDESFVVAAPDVLAEALRDPALWQQWWPDLEVSVVQDRGRDGQRFAVTGALVGTAEFWLEPWGDGVVLHYFLRGDLTRPGSAVEPREVAPRRAAREVRDRSQQHKRGVWALKDRLEAGRVTGEPRQQTGASPDVRDAAAPTAPTPGRPMAPPVDEHVGLGAVDRRPLTDT